jgi:hypothetical protein
MTGRISARSSSACITDEDDNGGENKLRLANNLKVFELLNRQSKMEKLVLRTPAPSLSLPHAGQARSGAPSGVVKRGYGLVGNLTTVAAFTETRIQIIRL